MSKLFFPLIVTENIIFDKMTCCLAREFAAFCNIHMSAETHHVDSSRLVHGAHGHEGGQADGDALERPAPARRKATG